MIRRWISLVLLGVAPAILIAAQGPSGDAALGTQPYEKFETDQVCAECHVDITRQHQQAMMSQSYMHHWDEIEYFELALPHAGRSSRRSPASRRAATAATRRSRSSPATSRRKRPAEGTRANEGVSCDLCHSIVGFEGDTPYNFNFVVAPAKAKQGVRAGTESPHHGIAVNPFLKTAEYCGTCHNEKDPYDQWVKATHLEWKEGPQAKAGIVCQDCHMPPAAGNSAPEAGGADHPDVRQHLFHGAHDQGKLAGAVEVRVHPEPVEASPGATVVLTATVVNAKAGHMIPTGSAEERVVWLHVEAVDAAGATHHLKVDAKGFDGEA